MNIKPEMLQRTGIVIVILSLPVFLGVPLASSASAEGGCNAYIYGMHDYNSTVRDLLTYNGERRGWVLVLQSLDGYTGGTNPDVINAANDGLGVLVRLHWGYGSAGTLPPQSQYDTFASRASLYIQTHIDYCKFYHIGNEPNLCGEWPGGGAADGRCTPFCSDVREWITSDRYADCFQRVYNALPPQIQSEAKLCLQPAATWAGDFRCAWAQEFDTDDFVCYTQECYNKIPHYMIGGLAFHPKTHNHDPSEITNTTLSSPVFGCGHNESVYWYFYVYKDMLNDIPADLRDRAIFLSELNPHENGWTNNNNGYCVAAFDEIDLWNNTHSDRKITAMMLYRWDDGQNRWDIWSRPGVQQDLQAAVAQGQTANGLAVCGGTPQPTSTPAPPTPTPPPPSGDNLSEGKPAYASSVYGPGWEAVKALDGIINSSNKWCSLSENPSWWYVDLGQICDINTVKVFCEGWDNQPTYYNLRTYTVRGSNTTSVPVSDWLTLSTYDSGGGDGADMVQHSVSGGYRYIGLHITDAGIDDYSRVLEVQVFGTTDPPTFRLEVEDYDAYYDTTSGNSGGAYRSDDVDIEVVQNDDGRYNVGWTAAGEWLDFDLNVAASTYRVYVRHAGTSSSSIHIELDSEDVTGSISLPSTGGWQTWATKDAGTISVGSGGHTLRIHQETGGCNINYLRFVPEGPPQPTNTPGPTDTPAPTNTPAACSGESLDALTNMSFQTKWNYEPKPNDPPGWTVLDWTAGGPQHYKGSELSSGRPSIHRCKYELEGGATGTDHVIAKEIEWGGATTVDVSAYCAGRNWDGSSNGTMSIGVDLDGCASGWADADQVQNRTSNNSTWAQISLPGLNRPGGAGTFTLMLRANRSGANWNCQFDEVDAVATSTGPTNTPAPTNTAVPTDTPVPTNTPAPTNTPGGLLPITEDFESMPSWSSEYDASWGSAAIWSIQSGGQSGNYLQVSRGSEGSSAKVLVYNIPTNTDISVSIYMRCPNFGGGYWMESAYRLGNHTAQDFDENAGAWTMIKKFDSYGGQNGNGNTWTQYQNEVNSGSNTQISVGFKLGSSGGGGPTVGWDTLVIDEPQLLGRGPLWPEGRYAWNPSPLVLR